MSGALRPTASGAVGALCTDSRCDQNVGKKGDDAGEGRQQPELRVSFARPLSARTFLPQSYEERGQVTASANVPWRYGRAGVWYSMPMRLSRFLKSTSNLWRISFSIRAGYGVM